jgi:hypothetical protein
MGGCVNLQPDAMEFGLSRAQQENPAIDAREKPANLLN